MKPPRIVLGLMLAAAQVIASPPVGFRDAG
jgi:hypothetical protein